ncbi:MAG: hypothetical protein ABIO46_08565, partial [Chitinophagales bacterium]
MKNSLVMLVFCFSMQLQAQNLPQLIKDITPGPQNSDITDLVAVGDIVFFIAPDGSNSFQLWRTDGTTAGTYVVKVINPSSPNGMYSYFTSLQNVGGTLFFLADDGVHGVEYWKSDGTEAGTVLIKDIAPGSADAFTDFGIDADYLAVIGDILYVSAGGGTAYNDFELWRIDGTEAGTYMVKDIIPGTTGSHPELLSNAGGILYFQIRNASGIREVWKSDGTEGGTVFLKTVVNVLDRYERDGNYFIEYNGLIYFGAATEPYNDELFRTDGTPAGTELFLDLNPSDGSEPHGFYIFNNKLLFIAQADDDRNLYTSDGTVAGTQVLLDSNGNPAIAGTATDVGELTVYTGNRIYYAGGESNGNKIWTTDGTPSGTYKLANLVFDYSAEGTAVGSNAVIKLKDENESCYTFYETNGTAAVTSKSFDCDLLNGHNQLTTLGNKVIFAATSDDEGRELWSYEPAFLTGIETIANPEIQVFSNPSANGIFQFSIPSSSTAATINAYDVCGRKIY